MIVLVRHVQVECIRGNVLGVLNLADVTMQKGLHMTNFATGCIFHYDDKFTIESGKVSSARFSHTRMCCAYFQLSFGPTDSGASCSSAVCYCSL